MGKDIDRPTAATAKQRAFPRVALLNWYRVHRRTLPWRCDPTPWRVLVSEAMLQQTQVATAVDYFQRFIARFPTPQHLADAPEQGVLRLWQGLGYYRRARLLQAAAKAIVAEHGRNVPRAPEALRKLPGVGRYTAGAVASIAFGVRAAVVDGNVTRVLARWFALRDPIDAPVTRRELWRLAEELVPAGAPGDFNQALMELGATVCTPRGPKCTDCPLRAGCLARKRGLTETLPVTSPRPKPRAVTHHVVALRRGDGKCLFERRPGSGLWARLWQMPTCEALDDQSLLRWVHAHTGLRVTGLTEIERFTHPTTHRRIHFVVWRAQAAGPTTKINRLASRWRSLDDVDDLPLANPQRRAVAAAQREDVQGVK